MTLQEIKNYIIARIYPNTAQEITGQALQDTLTTMAEQLTTREDFEAYKSEATEQIADRVTASEFEAYKDDIAEALDGKQATLVSGENIKTVSGKSLVGGGNVDITKEDVGLGNVDNTSDANKPISTAVATALLGKVDKVEGKGLSTNDYTDADKALVQTIPNLATKNEVNTVQESTIEAIEGVRTELEAKANKDGYYPLMSVGMADNLVGRGDVQDAQINFRPSGGELGVGNGMNISDAAARIEKIKGNSVVWNQLYKIDTPWLNVIRSSVSRDGNNITISATENDGKAATYGTSFITAGHKAEIEIEASVYGRVLFGVYRGDGSDHVQMTALEGDGSPRTYKIIQLQTTADALGFYIPTAGDSVEFDERSIKLTDLTKMFGAGNEPTTVSEFYQRRPINIADEFAHNEGELIDMKVDSLISTSDNAYDYVKGYARVMGGHTYDCSYGTAFVEKVYFSTDKNNIVAEENAMTSENGKYTFPSDGYAVPYTTDGDVREYCVCLQHTYTKPHPPYQQDVKDLSFIGEAFTEGMRSAGSVFDEIRYNATTKKWEKVVRVGVRAYAEGDTEDNSVMTDGTTTNYPLANPTPTPIDLSPNFNPNFLAWDFGTEEAIASVPSAPFRADINYEPNAVDDLRWAIGEIRSLRTQLAQLQSVASEN